MIQLVNYLSEKFLATFNQLLVDNNLLIKSSNINKLINHSIFKTIAPTIVYIIHKEKIFFVKNDRFSSFYDYLFSLKEKAILDFIYQKYSVDLEKEASQSLNFKIRGIIQSLKNIQTHYDANSIDSYEFGLGDVHNKGESVVKFSYKNNFWIYKPQNCLSDIAINETIHWINKDEDILLPIKKIISFNDYSFQEYINAQKNIDSYQDAEFFYYKIGMWLCLGYFLCIHDGHLENIIAKKDTPYWIDFEAAFNADKDFTPEDTLLFIHKKNIKRDVISGLQGKEGFITSFTDPVIYNNYSDDIYIQYTNPANNARYVNRIYLNERILEPYNYIDFIEKGFRRVAFKIQKNKTFFSNQVRNLVSKVDTIRVIKRSTRFYGLMIAKSKQPQIIVQENMWDRIKEDLQRQELLSFDKDKLNFVIDSEIEDLKKNMIPYFYRDSFSLNLYNSQGYIYNNFYNNSIIDSLLHHINCIDEVAIHNAIIGIKESLMSFAE